MYQTIHLDIAAENGIRMPVPLNDGQMEAYNNIKQAVNSNDPLQPRQFFLDGPGGTGKSFL